MSLGVEWFSLILNNKRWQNMSEHGHYIWRDGWVKTDKQPRGLPSIYFRKPYFDPNLADDKAPHGRFVESKRHKAQIMKQLDIAECGDRKHGSRSVKTRD